MKSQITIIGLGQIGTSIGLALEKYKGDLLRVGHDKNMVAAKDAEKLGAVDKVKRNLPNSVRDADIIILSLPFGEMQDTLKYIAQDVKKDAIIFDTGVGKAAVHAWVQEYLPVGQMYVGLVPVINPLYLYDEELGVKAAQKDLFDRTSTLLAAPASASESAINAAVMLIQMIGSQPLFTDIVEADGLMAAAHLMPQLTAAALLNATLPSSGWGETRKITGRAFAETTRSLLHQGGAASLAEAAFANRQNLGFKLDELLASIQQIKSLLDADDKEALLNYLSEAEEGRNTWDVERHSADWLIAGKEQLSGIEPASMMARLFGYRERKPKN